MRGMNTSADRTRVVSIVFAGRKRSGGGGAGEYLGALLEDGRLIAVSLDMYPTLKAASAPERRKWRLVGRGQGVHWPDLDLDLSAEGIIAARPDATSGARSQMSQRALASYLVNALARGDKPMSVSELAALLSNTIPRAKLRTILNRAMEQGTGRELKRA